MKQIRSSSIAYTRIANRNTSGLRLEIVLFSPIACTRITNTNTSGLSIVPFRHTFSPILPELNKKDQ
jgi:hypothetical protein